MKASVMEEFPSKKRGLVLIMHNDKRWHEISESLALLSSKHLSTLEYLWVGNYRFPSGVRPEINAGIECRDLERSERFSRAKDVWLTKTQLTDSLESEESSFFQGQFPMPLLRRLHRRIAGHRAARFENDFAAYLQRANVDFVVIPNGRIAISQVAEATVRSKGIEIWFTETNLAGFAKPVVPARFFLKKFPIHKRELLQAEILSKQSNQEDSEIFNLWISERSVPKSAVNSFSKTWSEDDTSNESFMGIGQDKVLNVFFTSSTDEFAALGQEWNQVSWANQYEAFYFVINELMKTHNDNFVIRVHPNLQTKDLANVWRELVQITKLRMNYPQVAVVLPDSKLNSYNLIDLADRVFVSVSSIGLEASGLGKPVWSFYPNYYDNVADVRKLHSPSESTSLQTWDVDSSRAHFFAHQAMRLGFEYRNEKNLVNDNSLAGGIKAAGFHDAWFRTLFVPYRAFRRSMARILIKTYPSIWKHLMTFALSLLRG